MHCSNYGNVHVTGQFCENKLVATLLDSQSMLTNEVTLTRREVEPNVHIQIMKQRFRVYRTYFTKQLRKPSPAYERGETELSSGQVSIILFIALFTISLFLLTKSLNLFNSLCFSSFIIEVFLLTLVLIGIAIISIFIANYVFVPQHTFDELSAFMVGN
ncbi:hypothetical protein [Psychrobacillus sp. L4]|uniref:hypothetical protein n=1 Tax=Psychrobacillus sp. L4 TaxID=3236892 RepID=UPI0036F2FAD3